MKLEPRPLGTSNTSLMQTLTYLPGELIITTVGLKYTKSQGVSVTEPINTLAMKKKRKQ